jgi:hypothetical protein
MGFLFTFLRSLYISPLQSEAIEKKLSVKKRLIPQFCQLLSNNKEQAEGQKRAG